jgi:enoyl-CoA hydratase
MGTVRTELHGDGVLVATLDKPPANAIDESLLGDLAHVVREAARNDAVRSLVLTGTGRFFCSGFDFASPRRDDVVAVDLYELYRDCHVELFTFPKPTIALVNGHAVAGGLVLVLACDVRIGRRSPDRIGFTEVVVGASFPRVAFEIVRLRLTNAALGELLLGARLYEATDGLRLGVFEELAAPEDLERVALERAARLGAYPREAYAFTKGQIIEDAAARIRAETPGEAMSAMAVWISEESRAARRRKREQLGVV